MQKRPLLSGGFLLLVLLASCRSSPPILDAPAPPIDFRELLHFSEVYSSVRYKSPPGIREDWAAYYDELDVVDLTAVRNLYLVGTLQAQRRQEIVIRGTTNIKNTPLARRKR